MKTKYLLILLIATAGGAASAAQGRGPDDEFDFEVLRYHARMLAAKP